MRKVYKYIVAAAAVLAFGITPLFAEGDDKNYDAIKANKKVTANADGTYTIDLETFVTGELRNVISHEITEARPLDVVLVLDVSGSMNWNMDGDEMTATSSDRYDVVASTNNTSSLSTSKTYYIYRNSSYVQVKYVNSNGSSSGNKSWRYRASNNNWPALSSLSPAQDVYEKNTVETYPEPTRLDELKTAVTTFVNSIAADALSTGLTHRISLVKFSGSERTSNGDEFYTSNNYEYNYSQIVRGLTSTYSDVISDLNKLRACGATRADYGMSRAASVLSGISSDRKSKRLVVMFTDGDPTSGSNYSETVASAAVKNSNTCKTSYDATVYTVGVFSSKSTQIDAYMNRVSSNYTGATSVSNGTAIAKDKQVYYIEAKNASDLANAFEKIKDDATTSNPKEGSDVELETTEVTLKDIITPSFQIPAGNNKIRFYAVPAKTITVSGSGSNETFSYIWDYANQEELTQVTCNRTVDASTGSTTVDITGFDFSAHWVGLHRKFEGQTGHEVEDVNERVIHPEGRMLLIKIDIEPNPDNVGGKVTTNEAGSGIYIDGKGLTVEYPKQPERFIPVDLVVERSNLAAGESAIYTVTRYNGSVAEESFKIILTSNGDGAQQVIAKCPVGYYDNPNDLTTFHAYTYKVVEDESWDWAYEASTCADAAGKVLWNTEKNEADNVFVFTANKSTSVDANLYDEAAKTNKFKVYSE